MHTFAAAMKDLTRCSTSPTEVHCMLAWGGYAWGRYIHIEQARMGLVVMV